MADLFTNEELAAKLQREVDNASADLARETVTALIEAYCGQSFTEEVETTAALRVSNGKIRLTKRPVTEVSSVKLIYGDRRDPTFYEFDGIDTVALGSTGQILNLPERDSCGAATAEVTWTHGYDTPPGDVKAVALAAAGRSYGNPRGFRSETIGQYSYTAAGADDDVASDGLLASERLTLGRYRSGNRTMELRA